MATTEFPHNATVRELRDALNAVPEGHLDLEVDVMFTPPGVELYEGLDLPGVVYAFHAFPEAADGSIATPSGVPACYTIRAKDGDCVGAIVETLREFQKFHDEEGDQ